jgi:hypothetical protein
MKLTMPVVEELLQHLYREKFVEVRGLISYGNNRYGMLDRGWQRAQQLLGLNGYIGPAPVSLSEYTYSVLRQSAAREAIQPGAVRDAMSNLVLPEDSINLGRSPAPGAAYSRPAPPAMVKPPSPWRCIKRSRARSDPLRHRGRRPNH